MWHTKFREIYSQCITTLAGYTVIKNEDIMKDLKIELDYMQQYQENWKSHRDRIDMERFLKAILK
jgi:hypothetical protein